MADTPLYQETVKSIQAAVARARIAWIAALIITFVYFGGLYNQRSGYIDSLIARREILIAIVERDLCGFKLDAIATGLGDLGATVERLEFFDRAREGHTPEMAHIEDYCSQLESEDLPDTGKARLKREMIKRIKARRDELEDAKWQLDRVSIPGTSIAATSSDMGIIGSLALLIVGFWLLANLRNEKDALLNFLGAHRDEAGQWSLNLRGDGFTEEEMRHAYEPIVNAFVFTPPRRSLLIDTFDTVTFLAPIIVVVLTLVYDGIDLIDKGLWAWHINRYCVSVFLGVLVIAVWSYCVVLNTTTKTVLRLWFRDSHSKADVEDTA